MTSVSSIDAFRSRQSRTDDPVFEVPVPVAAPVPSPVDDGQHDLLMGFLADFHSALREPSKPVPPPDPTPGSRPHLPSRLAAIVPAEREIPEHLLDPAAQAPLPTWPPPPDGRPAPAVALAAPPTETGGPQKSLRLRRLVKRG